MQDDFSIPARPLRVLMVHNCYQHAGGEDSVVASEMSLLHMRGHEVRLYERHNSEIESLGKASLVSQTIWSRRTVRDMEREIRDFSPDIVHVHNTFPLISPSVYWVANSSQVPVIQTIHNFRLLCLQAMFLRDGEICEDCLGKSPWRGIVRRCYRGGYMASTVAGLSLQAHRLAGTFAKGICRYVALNEFCRDKLIAGGVPADRIRIKPNFVAPIPVGNSERTGNPLFVGRLSEEKGVELLRDVIRRLPGDAVIDIVGSGPLEEGMAGESRLRMLGAQSPDHVFELMRNAPFLIMPSIWYENMPRTLVEAYACGTPVIASRLGALAELVQDEKTGLLFAAGSGDDLAKKIGWALMHKEEMRGMGRAARNVYDESYTPESNYKILMDIYADAIGI